MARINEDIRFYLPADPYYYQVDNLPLQDLLDNDIVLQEQIDNINLDTTNSVTRAGIRELQPHIDVGLPGQVAVRSGNFVGRTNRTNDVYGGELGGSDAKRVDNGTTEMNVPATEPGQGPEGGKYSVSNPPNEGVSREAKPAKGIARTAVFNFPGGSVPIDAFNSDEFGTSMDRNTFLTTPPLGRIDLIGITTVNGAMDDPFLPGNVGPNGLGKVATGDGTPRLAVVKGAGIVQNSNSHKRQLSTTVNEVGRRFFTIGTAQERLNDYGRDLDGNVVPDPEFGTVPMPDDVVNILYSRDDIVADAMFAFASRNLNSSFFLPLAYVFVPNSFVAGTPIPGNYLKDIRPLFRTAELSLQERQGVAFSQSPDATNPFVTENRMSDQLAELGFTTENTLASLIRQLEGTTVQTVKTPYGGYNWEVFKTTALTSGISYEITNGIREIDRGKRIIGVFFRWRTTSNDITERSKYKYGFYSNGHLADDPIVYGQGGGDPDHSRGYTGSHANFFSPCILQNGNRYFVRTYVRGGGDNDQHSITVGNSLSISGYIIQESLGDFNLSD